MANVTTHGRWLWRGILLNGTTHLLVMYISQLSVALRSAVSAAARAAGPGCHQPAASAAACSPPLVWPYRRHYLAEMEMEASQVTGRRRLCPGGVPPHSSAGGAARGPALRNVTRCLLLALSGPRSGSGPEEPGQGTGTRRTAATRTCTCTTAAVRARARWARSSNRCCR